MNSWNSILELLRPSLRLPYRGIVYPLAVTTCIAILCSGCSRYTEVAVVPNASASSSKSPNIQADELKRFLGVSRYELRVPEEKRGMTLGLEIVTPEGEKRRGGHVVQGGEEMVLLFQYEEGERVRTCWIGQNFHVNGSDQNFFPDGLLFASRPEGTLADGDWIIRGDKASLPSMYQRLTRSGLNLPIETDSINRPQSDKCVPI
ncbi:MAG: hypothetical protein MUC83_06985 [Pirellula sp.]|nr:hypothetical protein [Pirellula sp.]